jgi:hypothetical protein
MISINAIVYAVVLIVVIGLVFLLLRRLVEKAPLSGDYKPIAIFLVEALAIIALIVILLNLVGIVRWGV